ncbi:EFR1 family ferrodoxin [Clostridium fungisolvens]|uniref:Ion-translocating oxidoreductase complex subunit B n=1 Tax=Clostridium fungisolvens TaxID=1604897 RepID=A0A6V8SDF4_9CLOT|nr:EFR1 family ferrodoxin [Clostridium fungisolvens]GFP74485.1 Ion-translocating oxidoreductase complex subunit B [Clostridium fungisolvens]
MIMKGAILYFSLTGNTKLACEYIISKIHDVEFDLMNMRDGYPNLDEYNIIGFATYADEYSIAEFVKEYIDGMESINKPAFVFSTYGKDNGAATKVLAEKITKKGFKVVLDHGLNTPENYPPVMKHDHGHINNPTKQQMDEFNIFIDELSKICLKIRNREVVNEKKVLVKTKYIVLSKLGTALMMRKIMGAKKVDSTLCIQCKKCVNTCPYKVIKMNDFPVFDEAKCHGCFACYNLCPTKAIYTNGYNKFGHYPKPNKAVIEKLKV